MSVYLNLTAVIDYLYPNATPTDWASQINSDGSQSLTRWNTATLGAMPTDAQLNSAWPTVQINSLRGPQIALIQQSYETHVTGGFSSSALGSAHTYTRTASDQFNNTASVVGSMLPNLPAVWTTLFWCGDSSTPQVWNYLPHTATAQIQQVGIDCMAFVMAAKQHQAALLALIQAATTAAAIEAFVW